MALKSGQGFTVHRKENQWTSRTLHTTSGYKNTSGTVTIGRLYSDRDGYYGNVMADELTFWNRQLTDQEVGAVTKYASIIKKVLNFKNGSLGTSCRKRSANNFIMLVYEKKSVVLWTEDSN